jgi:hypothetical protein
MLALVGACGTAVPGSTGGGSAAATSSTTLDGPTPTSSSATPPSPSPTSTAAADLLVPASVLETSLATKVLGRYYTVEYSDSGEYPTTGGLNISSMGEYVSGDRACRTMFDAHTSSPESFAYVSMTNKSAWFEEVAESYPTVADARKVMAENTAQAKACRTFKMRTTENEVATFKHTVTAAKHGDVDMFLHHFNAETKRYLYEFHLFEGRVGGELMNIMWASTNFRADPSSTAFTQFQKVVNQYRKDHPRGGNGSDTESGSGASPVTALPTTGAVRPNHRPVSHQVMGRMPR